VIAEAWPELLPEKYLEGIDRVTRHISVAAVKLPRCFKGLISKSIRLKPGKKRKVTSLKNWLRSAMRKTACVRCPMLGCQLGVGAYRAIVDKRN